MSIIVVTEAQCYIKRVIQADAAGHKVTTEAQVLYKTCDLGGHSWTHGYFYIKHKKKLLTAGGHNAISI